MWFIKSKPKPKVFCINCKWLEDGIADIDIDTDKEIGTIIWKPKGPCCSSPYTKYVDFDKDTYLQPGTHKKVSETWRHCVELNAKNDCFWFNRE